MITINPQTEAALRAIAGEHSQRLGEIARGLFAVAEATDRLVKATQDQTVELVEATNEQTRQLVEGIGYVGS